MKKIYQNPTIKVVKMRTVQMIASSPTLPAGYKKELNDNPTDELGNGGNALGRRSLWDDEEEEDF